MGARDCELGRALCLICFPPVSRSLHCSREDAEVWHWLLRRVRRLADPLEFRVILHEGAEPPEWQLSRLTAPPQVHFTSLDSIIGALLESVGSGDWDAIVYLTLNCGFAPEDSIARLLAEHRAKATWYTSFSGLPEGVSPAVLGRELLQLAASVTLLAQEMSSMGTDAFFRRCVDVARQTEYPEAKLYEVPVPWESPGRLLPPRVEIHTPSGRVRLRRISRNLEDPSVDGLELLARWRQDDDREQRTGRWTPWISQGPGTERILFVSNPSAYSGAEEAICRTIQGLCDFRSGLYALVGLEGHFASQLRALGVNVSVAGQDISIPTSDNAKLIADVLHASDPHVVHLNSFSGPLIGHFAKLRGCGIVYHVRVSSIAPIFDAVRQCDAVIAVSEYVKTNAVRAGLAADKVTVVYDGVETETWLPVTDEEKAGAKNRRGIDPCKITVLMIGRYAPNKRHDLLVQAVASLPERAGVHLVIVGESHGSNAWENHLDDLLLRTGVGSQTTKLGFQTDVRQIQKAADICVLCSEQEPLGMAILEAMSMSIPVIVSDDGGLQELVGDRCGVVVRPAVAALAQALSRLIGDPRLRSLLGRNGRELCLQKCRVEDCASSIELIYRKLITQQRCAVA
jgi:glycosyltransferase involved in cell wall biosynthesis